MGARNKKPLDYTGLYVRVAEFDGATGLVIARTAGKLNGSDVWLVRVDDNGIKTNVMLPEYNLSLVSALEQLANSND